MNEQLDLFYNNTAASCESAATVCAVPQELRSPADQSDEADQALLTRQLHEELQYRSGLHISLTVTDNTSTMMSVRHLPDGSKACVRLHRMFLTAPTEVRKALAYWIKHPRSRKHGALFRDFIVARSHEIRSGVARANMPVTQGRYYDLKEIFRELNQRYFDNAIDVAISWGRDCGRNTRSIRFGGYYPNEQLIRIHPRLDQAFVPAFVVRYIVYHEMLHAHIGIEQTEGKRRSMHPRIFKRMEAAFPEYEPALAWIENGDNLRRVLRRSRR